jgi:branched-chain amino acid transport system permease protein
LSTHHVTRSTRASRVATIIAALALIVLAAAPWWAGRADMRLMGEIFLYLSLACLWNLMAGYAGLVSVGQQAFVGFGGYMLFALTMFGGLHPIPAILLGGVLAAILSIPVATLIFRLKGAYFAIGTWVMAEVFRLSFAQVSSLGGGSGSSLPVGIVKSLSASRSGREALSYWLALGAAVTVITCVYFFLRSRRGLALTAIRDSEVASAGLGIDIWRTKLEVYVVTSAFTAIIGGLIFLQKLRISPDAAFSVNDWTAFVIFIVVIGGIGTLEGPIIGTLIFFALRETLADFGTIYLMVLGLVAIIVMLKAPKGVWGLIRDAILSIPVATLIFRLKGAYFAIGTWVMAEVFRLSFAQVSSLGGGSGSSLPVGIVKSLSASRSGREALSYWLALGAAVTVITCVYFFLRSRRGLALTAIRDSEVASAGLGIDIWRTKLEVYVVTSAFTAIIGGLIFLQKLRISPDAAFSVNDWTAFVIFIVVIGGIGTLEGPIIGTLIFFALRETLADFGTIYLMVLGLVAIIVMLKAPKGVWGLIRDRYDLELFPLSYRVRVDTQNKGD